MIERLFAEAVQRHQAGDLAHAERLYGDVLRTQPHHAPALYLLGYVRYQRDDFVAAERLIGKSLALGLAAPDAFYNRGCALQKLRRNEEAVAAFEAAVRLKPDYPEALFNRGTALLTLRRHADALQCFDGVIALTPDDAEAWFNRGGALQGLRRWPEAAASYDKALALMPLLPFCEGSRFYCKLQYCDWAGLESAAKAISAGISGGAAVVSPLEDILISGSPVEQLGAARIWTAKQCPPAAPPWKGERHSHARARIAYLSADFRAHAVGRQILAVLEQHDPDRFEIMAVSYGPEDGSEERRQIVAACGRFEDVRTMDDDSAAALVRNWGADIAVELTGHTMDGRLGILARRPAPAQVSFLGFPGTLGAPYIDYILADGVVLPPEQNSYFDERIVRLDGCFYPAHAAAALPAPSRRDAGLPDEGVVFTSFNAICKILPETFAAWMRILSAVEKSVLWLPEPHDAARKNLRREAESLGVAADRIVFAPFVSGVSDHLARLQLADVFLDTWPYGAHTTASDALSVGLPLVTFPGRTFASRVGASMLTVLQLPELIAGSIAEYEAIACRLAADAPSRTALKSKLARNRPRLFDIARYTRSLEAAYTGIIGSQR